MNRKLVLGFFFALAFPLAYADTADVSIVNTVTASIAAASGQILPQALIWLGSFMALQFVITNFGLLKSGADIDAVFGKLIGSLAWFGFCVYLINNGPDFIDSVGNGILNKFAPNIPGPGAIISATLALCSSLLIAIAALGTSVLGVGNSSLAMVLVYVLFVVFSIGMYMAIKVFMLTLELGLVVMLSPLSFSFLGLNALKDQGIAPLKSLISLVYRIILLGIIYAAFSEVIGVAGKQLNDIDWANPFKYASAMNIIFSMLCAFPMLAYLVYKSDSIAASLAGGSSNMGTADIASAAAVGAAAGAAIGSGSGFATSAASKIPESMSSFMKGLAGGGSVSNASTRGAGAAPVGTAPMPPATSSSAFPTRKDGSPLQSAGVSPAESAPAKADDATPSSQGSAGAGSGSSPTATSAASPGNTPDSATPLSSTGSGANAGIGGTGSKLESDIGRLVQNMGNQGGARKPSLSERLSNVNNQVAQEKAGTHVSISTHNTD